MKHRVRYRKGADRFWRPLLHYATATLLTFAFVAGGLVMLTLVVDAREYETTGRCDGCVILNKIRDL